MPLSTPLALIGRFIQATVQPSDSAEILQTLSDLLTDHPRIAGIATYIKEPKRFALHHSFGFAVEHHDTLLAWDGIAADAEITTVLLAYLQSAEVAAIVHCTPLIGDTETLGALCLFARNGTPFTAAEIEFFETLGKVVGVSLHNAHLYAAEQASRQQIKQVAQRLLISQELERERIANELHRNAVQELVGLKIHLDMLSAESPTVPTDLMTAMLLCEGVLSRLSLLALALRPAVLQDLGLNTALQSYCREITARTGATIHYMGMSDFPLIDNALAIALYRFLQESLSTIQSGHVTVQLAASPNSADSPTITLSILQKDGTVGDETERIGLAGMRERLEAVGGTLTEEQDGRGFLLTALIQL